MERFVHYVQVAQARSVHWGTEGVVVPVHWEQYEVPQCTVVVVGIDVVVVAHPEHAGTLQLVQGYLELAGTVQLAQEYLEPAGTFQLTQGMGKMAAAEDGWRRWMTWRKRAMSCEEQNK